MRSPTTPLSVENELMVGATGAAGVDGDGERARGHPGIAGGIGGGGGQAVGAIGQRWRGVAPGAGPARGHAVEQRRTVIDLDRRVGFRRAGERQRIVIGDVVAHHPAVGRERGDGRGNRRVGGSICRPENVTSAAERFAELPATSLIFAPFKRLTAVIARAETVASFAPTV